MTIADIKKTMESKMDQSIQAFSHGLTKFAPAEPTLVCSILFKWTTTATSHLSPKWPM